MDQFYDINKAEILLQKIAECREPKNVQLLHFQSAKESIRPSCQVIWAEASKCWKLVEVLNEDKGEEVVLRVQGILCNKALPPIRFPFQIEPRQRPYLRQNISLTGLGAESLTESIASIHNIHEMFSREFPQGAIEDWKTSTFDHHHAIDASCRYFTARTQAITDDIIPISKVIDPDGVLEGAICERYVYTTDNVVEYYELVYNNGISYNTINPTKFRIGDIVEAQVSFIAVPLRERRYKMLVVLRALTLLNDSPLRDAAIARNRFKNNTVTTTSISFKRKVGYSKDEVDDASEKIRRLKIDE